MSRLIRRPYADSRHLPTPISFAGSESRTHQSFKTDADINTIVARFQRTGEFPQPKIPPRYGDFTDALDYHAALNVIHDAEDAFASLPSSIREEYANDPARYLAAVEEAHAPDADPALVAKLTELGVLRPQTLVEGAGSPGRPSDDRTPPATPTPPTPGEAE